MNQFIFYVRIIADQFPKTDSNQASKKLQEEIMDKVKIIERAETSQKMMEDLVRDRNEMIESQRIIINNTKAELEELKEDLRESRNIIGSKEEEINECRNELHTSIEKNREHIESHDNELILKKLEDLTTLNEKTELAYEVQNKLINSKCELIESLKMQISENKQPPSCSRSGSREQNNLTSQINTEGDDKENGVQDKGNNDKIPGLQESILCLSSIALHGIVTNGLLLWIDVQRRTCYRMERKRP